MVLLASQSKKYALQASSDLAVLVKRDSVNNSGNMRNYLGLQALLNLVQASGSSRRSKTKVQGSRDCDAMTRKV